MQNYLPSEISAMKKVRKKFENEFSNFFRTFLWFHIFITIVLQEEDLSYLSDYGIPDYRSSPDGT